MANDFMLEIEKIPVVKELKKEFMDYWGEFIEGVFYSDLARSILKNNLNYSNQEIKSILLEVEKGMLSDNQRVQDLLATCFLQALSNEMLENENKRRSIINLLGEVSLTYLIEWEKP